ncbi:hypothetical protein B566_EDAN010537 [Ephemera danica]|nr:hypothetical protein B566_EDAN010537 [Ephemera danica]
MRELVFLALLIWAPKWARGANCGNVGCIGTLDTCPPGQTLTPNITLNNCCPGCKQYLNQNEQCEPGLDNCLPGLDCVADVCAPSNVIEERCQSYPFREQLWWPKCEADGSFAPVQCKGERLTGRCFCYSREGERIFGQEWWNRSENMTCACSRRVEELKNANPDKLVDVTIHCSADGNFEALQCSDGVCWCAEPRWGDAIGEVGSQYLRQCDSSLSALTQLRIEMSSHGTLGDSFIARKCGLDGTYGEYQLEGANRYCRWKDNTNIDSYMADCARDKKYYELEGYGWTMQCDGKGSYLTVQRDDEGEPVCVDKDGFQCSTPIITGTNVECTSLPWEKSKSSRVLAANSSSLYDTVWTTRSSLTTRT